MAFVGGGVTDCEVSFVRETLGKAGAVFVTANNVGERTMTETPRNAPMTAEIADRATFSLFLTQNGSSNGLS
jgi:hypothetical protein